MNRVWANLCTYYLNLKTIHMQVATKLYLMEQQKRQIERIQKACTTEFVVPISIYIDTFFMNDKLTPS